MTKVTLSVMQVDQGLIDRACSALAVREISPLKDGGQKVVRLVSGPGGSMVLKLVAVGSSQPDALKRAHREVELLQSIENVNVVQVRSPLVEIGDPAEGAAWLEEYLDGNDLAELLGPQWSWAQVSYMAKGVAAGLGALHEVGVVHRDLSASNVRVTSSGVYKVLDPGFARHTLKSGITVGGQPGTPGYMSPEHLNVYSGAPTASSDIFCVGILMYIAATGALPIPYSGDNSTYIEALGRVQVPSLQDIRPDFPPSGVELIMRCLHRQPARRFRNGAALLNALEGVA